MITHPTPGHLKDFFVYKESQECKGFLGVKNLLLILKKDARIAFKEYGITFPTTKFKLKEIRPLILNFNIFWKDWSRSSFCNLTSLEVSVIDEYRVNPNYKTVGLHLNLTEDQVYRHLNIGISKLRSSEAFNLFQKWKDCKHLQINSKDSFLDMPLEGLKLIFPEYLLNTLSFFGSTMREVLQTTSLKELRTYKRFSKKTEHTFINILTQYDCFNRLN